MASVIEGEVVKASVADLKEYPNNPRKGNVDVIAESLKENKQFRPLIVQKSTNYILGGNHTFLGAKKLRWKKIDVVYVDVDDDHAKKIVLADNRTSDLATYNTEALMSIINSLDTPDVGTGYSEADINSLVTGMAERDADLIQEVITDRPKIEFAGDDDELTFEEKLTARDEAVTARQEGRTSDDIEDLKGAFDRTTEEAARADKILAEVEVRIEKLLSRPLPSSNYWGVPDLDPDMLVEEFPEKIVTWAGKDVSKLEDIGEDGYFMHNWGSASSSELPWDRTILGFFSHDHKWVSFYENMPAMVAKVITRGVTMAFQPDNSLALGDVRFFHLLANFQSKTLARVMQDCGIKIIPNLLMCDGESAKITMNGLPKKLPTLAVEFQAMTEDQMFEMGLHTLLRTVVSELKPKQLMVYGGPPAQRVLDKAKLPKSTQAFWQPNMSHMRNLALKPWHEKNKNHKKNVQEAREKLGVDAPEEPEEPDMEG